MATISVTAGSTVACRRAKRLSPGLTIESAGATERWTANAKMSSVPSTNSGSESPTSVITEISESASFPLKSAASVARTSVTGR